MSKRVYASVPRFAIHGMLAVGMLLSLAAALVIGSPPHAPGESTAPQALADAVPARGVTPVSEINFDGPAPLVRLTGVVLGEGGARAALVSVNNAPPVLVRIGDPLSKASTVQAIGGDWMAYSHGTVVMRVRAQDADTVKSSAALATGQKMTSIKP